MSVRVLALMQTNTFEYVGTFIAYYLSIPAHSVCGGRCPGGQGGKSISISSSLVPATYQGCFH